MALEDRYRVTKNASAGKSTAESGSLSALQVKALKASHAAYIDSITEDHEEIVQKLSAEHAEEISALKKQAAADVTAVSNKLAHERQAVDANQKAAVAEATRKAMTDSAERFITLRRQLDVKQAEVETLQTSQKTDLENSRNQAAIASQKVNRLQVQNDNLKKAHANQVKELEAKLAIGPNSWLQIHFKGKGRTKSRVYFKRYTANMYYATIELRKELDAERYADYVFRHGSPTERPCEITETL